MTIFPVLDLLNGQVVRGVAGQRDEYRPITSRLASRPDPLTIARAFRDTFDLTELYVADLDAILHGRPNGDIYRALAEDGFSILVDAGLRDINRAGEVLDTGATAVIAGLETSPGPQYLRRLCEEFGPEQVLFSLDLQTGRPMGDVTPWESSNPFIIAGRAVAEGITRMIVLDVARVGTSGGVSTLSLCGEIRARFPELRLITGGGIRNIDDLRSLQGLGLEGVLMASALHDGRITRGEIDALRRMKPV